MRTTIWTAGVLMSAAATAAIGQAPATSVQQLFDTATALGAKGDTAGALAAWEALEKRAHSNRRTAAIARVRKSALLLKLDRTDEAVAAARAGLADLPTGDATLQEDRYEANMTLGSIAETTLDYPSAVESFHAAFALAGDPATRLAALRGAIATGIFVDSDAAARDLATANALIATTPLDKTSQAIFLRLGSELALNRKDYVSARKQAEAAVARLGGLTVTTDLYDVAARSDFALAALLSGRLDSAREYLAYTGAGRLPKGRFDPASDMKVPDCGGEAGLRPNDAAVIEFSIEPDGSVSYAAPVWSAANGAAALEFARTARSWSFDPEKVKALPTFFRYRARVEMRCSTAFERPSIGDYFDGALRGWLAGKQIAMPSEKQGSDVAALPALRARLAASGADTVATIPVLIALADNAVVPREESDALARRALAIAQANAAPPPARLAIERRVWASASGRSWDDTVSGRGAASASQDASYQADPETRAGIRLLAADAMRRKPDRALALLQPVADDKSLPANHPLRVGALIRIASIEDARGNDAAARAAFEHTGLAADQCALLDAPPKMLQNNSSSSDFPREAMEWGFEGWTQTQYDIDADGKVRNPRVIVSYPPFVFSDAGTRLVSHISYAKTYRPDGGLGCGGTSQRVRFSRN